MRRGFAGGCALADVCATRVCAAEAKSDLVNVLSSLEAHWHVLEAEVVEINRDIEYCEQCLRKYGEWFNSPLQYLRVPPCCPMLFFSTPSAVPASTSSLQLVAAPP